MRGSEHKQRWRATAGAALAFVPALVLWGVASVAPASAKQPGVVHCYNDICHRVRTVDETDQRRGLIEPVVASFYDWPAADRFNPSTETSSGAQFDADAPDNAASPIHPDGTILLVWSPVSKAAAIIRINNAGPYYPGRTLDVSRGVAEKLGFTKGGVLQLLTMVIAAPGEGEAGYRRGREYPKVRGFLGAFDNIALASLEDPTARDAVFRGNQPLPALALNSTRQLLLNATEAHFKSQAKTETLTEAAPELIEPPVLHASMLETGGETFAPDAALTVQVAIAQPPLPPATRQPTVKVTTTTLAALSAATAELERAPTSSPAEPAPKKVVRKAVDNNDDDDRPKAKPAPQPVVKKAAPTTTTVASAVTIARHLGRPWFNGETIDALR